MKILAFVDMHGSVKALEKIAEKAAKEDPDIIICAGDFTIFEQKLDYLMYKLDRLKKTVLMIPGNHESLELVRKAAIDLHNIINIHGKMYKFMDTIFLGYGGGGFSMVDKGFEKQSAKWEKEIRQKDKVVLVTHAPPYKTELDKIMEGHHGNKSIMNFIKKVDLALVICGHFHENAGKEHMFKKTRMINPGPYGKIVNI